MSAALTSALMHVTSVRVLTAHDGSEQVDDLTRNNCEDGEKEPRQEGGTSPRQFFPVIKKIWNLCTTRH